MHKQQEYKCMHIHVHVYTCTCTCTALTFCFTISSEKEQDRLLKGTGTSYTKTKQPVITIIVMNKRIQLLEKDYSKHHVPLVGLPCSCFFVAPAQYREDDRDH